MAGSAAAGTLCAIASRLRADSSATSSDEASVAIIAFVIASSALACIVSSRITAEEERQMENGRLVG